MTTTAKEQTDTSYSGQSARNTGNIDNQLLDQLLRNKSICFAILDVDFNFITVNKAYAHAHGKSRGFFTGKNYFDLYPSDAQQVFEKVRESKKSSRISAHPVIPLGQPEQDTTYWDWMVDPILNQENEVETMILAGTDVTKRVRTEQNLFKSVKILAAINHAQDLRYPYAKAGEIFNTLLAEVVDLTESEYGFIGNILRNAKGHPYMEVQTILNYTQSSEKEVRSVNQTPQYLDLTNPDTLIGEMIYSGEPMVNNNLANDSRDTGLPPGHPALKSFLGMPFNADKHLTGFIGVANCMDGYDMSLTEQLQPLLKSYMQLILSNAAYLESDETLTALDQSESLIRDLPTSAVENEHRELIDLINECYEEMHGDVDAEVIRQLIDKIYSAVAEHFLHEEELMRSTAYPEYEAHKKNHDGLLITLREKIDRFVKDPDHDISDLRRSLANWFGRHFSTFDNDLQNYFLAEERDNAESYLID